ncbi:MAG: hypothetical protein J5I47_13385 [Vicingus serpentipes]|nr:hypothetical protein [Vicingus serpentipes]
MSNALTHRKVDGGLEKITAFLETKGGKPLSKPLQKRLDKIDFVDNLIRNGRSPKQIITFLQKRFPSEGISRATAYRIIKDAKYVYGSTNREDKEYWRSVLVDLIFDTRKRARLAGDIKTMAACDNNLFRALALDKDDPDLPDFGRIQPPIQVLQINKTFIEKYENILPADILKKVKKFKVPAKNEGS